jgi:hypothetical protein
MPRSAGLAGRSRVGWCIRMSTFADSDEQVNGLFIVEINKL